MDLARGFTVILCTVAVAITTAAATTTTRPDSDECRASHVVRGQPVDLYCRGCRHTPTRWYNTTGALHQEIHSGIDRQSGELRVSDWASSDLGGQQYMCTCDAATTNCYNIHIPPLVSISLSSEDVVSGGEVIVTCSATDGYPVPSTITLVHSRGVETVQNGGPHTLRNLRVNDSGVVRCVMNDVPGQPSAAESLNVFNRPEVVGFESATFDRERGGTATLTCSVVRNHCRTSVMFFKDGAPVIQTDNERFTQFNKVSRDNLYSHLIIKGVEPGDVGRYECIVYANYSRLLPVASQELYLYSLSTATIEPSTEGASKDDSSSNCKTGIVGLSVALGVAVTLLVLSWIIFSIIICYLMRERVVTNDS